jgi:hypothetical protein
VKPRPDSVGDEDWYQETRPIATGFEPTMSEAEARAAATAGADSIQDHAWFASGYLGRLVAEKRMVRRPEGDDASPIEFVWEAYYYTSDAARVPDEWVFRPYRVVKKTARRAYVESHPYLGNIGAPDRERRWYDYQVDTFVLDRAELERGHGARRSKGRRYYGGDFYRSREEAEREILAREWTYRPATLPPWVELLGLEWPVTRRDVKAAYRRKAKEMHPDHGGDHDEFVKLEAAYRMALSTVKDLPPK